MVHQNGNDRRFRQAEFAAWVGIVGNIILAALKMIVGMLGNSRALMADAVHSASDVIGSLAVLVGLKAAKQPPDDDHPYGHGKAESIAAIIVAVILAIVGIQIGYGSVRAIWEPIQAPALMTIYVVILSIISKEFMFQYKYRLGKRLRSDALIVNAWEHRSDVFTSIAALIGIGGAILGGYIGVEWLVYFDPIAGIIVSLFVIHMAWKLGTESIHTTLDHVLHDEDAQELVESVRAVGGVCAVDQLHAREHGHYVIVDVKIAVDPFITVDAGHDIAAKVKAELLHAHDHVHNVFVHVNPYREKGDRGKKNVNE